jgi:Haem-binding domain/Cytochrome P460
MRPARSLRKTIRVLFFIGLIVFIGIQFIRPPLDNAPATADLKTPPEVRTILKRACYNCHSNETRLAWFDEPAPAYWLVVKDVKDARAVLNFSNWDSLNKSQQAGKLFESIFQIEQHAMPLSQYTFLHHGGILSADEIVLLKNYALTLAYRAKPDSLRERAAVVQYGNWIEAGDKVQDPAVSAQPPVKDEYNGLVYQDMANWVHWQPVSTTERYDNGSLRVILGNDVVVRAIREGHTHPYPDGAIFAKAAYAQNPDSTGEIRAGAFLQVEFMIRDSKRYASTFGWGWGRWVGGLAMKPYGHDATFVTECMNCHRPLASTDYTFTFPLSDTVRLSDEGPILPDSLGGRPLRGRLITSFVTPRDSTMSTLYGNGIAASNARSGQTYASGAVLSLVQWRQRDDPHWFGGRIPREVATVELLRFGAHGQPDYICYAGPRLAKKVLDAHAVEERVQYITAKRASVVPIGAIDDRPKPGL